MATKLTETRLRQIVREEASRLNEFYSDPSHRRLEELIDEALQMAHSSGKAKVAEHLLAAIQILRYS